MTRKPKYQLTRYQMDNGIPPRPRQLSELAQEMQKPFGHQQKDMLLIEALQSLVYHRTLNPQQRDFVLTIVQQYRLSQDLQGMQMSLFVHAEEEEEQSTAD